MQCFADVERSRCNRIEYRPRLGEYESFLDGICIFHPHGKHKTQDYNWLQGFADEVLRTAKKAEQEKKTKVPKGGFLEARKEVNYIFGGLTHMSQRESRSSQPNRSWRLDLPPPPPPEFLKWYEVSITSNRCDHPNFIMKPGWYPLIISPIIKDVKLNRVLVDGWSSLNILFIKMFDQMVLPRLTLWPSRAPLNGIVQGTTATPVRQITLPMMFETWENFRTEYMLFEVADFEMAYNAFLGRPALTKFMEIPHYSYLVLKMSGPQWSHLN
jgi:hypothetical protein